MVAMDIVSEFPTNCHLTSVLKKKKAGNTKLLSFFYLVE